MEESKLIQLIEDVEQTKQKKMKVKRQKEASHLSVRTQQKYYNKFKCLYLLYNEISINIYIEG